MDLKTIQSAIAAAIPAHGVIVVTHTLIGPDNESYSATVYAISANEEDKLDTVISQEVCIRKPEDLVEKIIKAYAVYKSRAPNLDTRIAKLKRQLRELYEQQEPLPPRPRDSARIKFD